MSTMQSLQQEGHVWDAPIRLLDLPNELLGAVTLALMEATPKEERQAEIGRVMLVCHAFNRAVSPYKLRKCDVSDLASLTQLLDYGLAIKTSPQLENLGELSINMIQIHEEVNNMAYQIILKDRDLAPALNVVKVTNPLLAVRLDQMGWTYLPEVQWLILAERMTPLKTLTLKLDIADGFFAWAIRNLISLSWSSIPNLRESLPQGLQNLRELELHFEVDKLYNSKHEFWVWLLLPNLETMSIHLPRESDIDNPYIPEYFEGASSVRHLKLVAPTMHGSSQLAVQFIYKVFDIMQDFSADRDISTLRGICRSRALTRGLFPLLSARFYNCMMDLVQGPLSENFRVPVAGRLPVTAFWMLPTQDLQNAWCVGHLSTCDYTVGVQTFLFHAGLPMRLDDGEQDVLIIFVLDLASPDWSKYRYDTNTPTWFFGSHDRLKKQLKGIKDIQQLLVNPSNELHELSCSRMRKDHHYLHRTYEGNCCTYTVTKCSQHARL